ncbi:MAG: hypothetical protein WD042_11375 [Phycisphaeraceae bacterium]
MRLFSYIVAHDTGFAPNPFWGCCTLANCKPGIRRTATEGDWIVGLSRKSAGNRIIYAMKIDETIDFATYYRDERFVAKRPDFTTSAVVCKCGDNIYEPHPDGSFRQLRSTHSNGKHENPETKAHDLGGRYVLVGDKFYYFGVDGPDLPPGLEALRVARGHKCRFTPDIIQAFNVFISQFDQGVMGHPTTWPTHDHSWRQSES